MSLTQEQAVDEILTLFKSGWDTTTHPAYYESVREDRDLDDTPWATTQIRHVSAKQSAVSGLDGSRMFDRIGLLTVQVFCPVGIGLSEGYALGKVLTDTFEGKSTAGGVWFRDVMFREVGREGAFYQWNFTTTFQYFEIK